ncbi:MAG: GrpB family protein [Anaerolineaceae bacterium]|nr:GrpB family protein [Anaerolineaceae bacterium]
MTSGQTYRIVELLPSDSLWIKAYSIEAENLKNFFGNELLEIHHIGSTAIPGILAKPIIDIMPVVKDIDIIDSLNIQMEAVGYFAKGEYGIPGRRYFFKGGLNHRTHHVHVFPIRHLEIERHLNFRDYLREHPSDAKAYSDLKEKLAIDFRKSPEKYSEGKTALIRELDEKAKIWKAAK